METTDNYLLVLSESLDKKIIILDELSRLTEEQKNIAKAEEFDEDAFTACVDKKDSLISELERLDNGFEMLYNNIKSQITGNKDMYAEQIKELQIKIKKILDKNASLQVAEESNRRLITEKFSNMRKEISQVKKSRDTVANYYKTMNSISSEPYFLDQKK